MLLARVERPDTQVTILWGDPGTGKTRRAYGDGDAYIKPFGQWWDGYVGQSTVIFDEFTGWLSLEEINKICDRYPYQCAVKGSYVWLRATKFYFTSNKDPREWWPMADPRSFDAFKRRVTECTRYSNSPLGVVTVVDRL